MKLLINLIVFFVSFMTFSQNHIEGNVTYINEFVEKQPLDGVSIFLEDTSTGTLSNINGDFKILKSNFSNNLVFKFLGFKDQIIQFKDQSTLSVIMVENENILEEVVVDKKRKTIQK